ncbi:MAG: hypothetical protein A2086_03630 [Spirochaetes bacterium GWD1_27_9]|nr:MAG: hypothetical protein A2Z98_10345 [Spirochaetes bacterium GWB1_27_13]OHD25452.1 MAG: hypothetical protein A2Y34_17705 [Spirochaetes bacterium GWC1_27_15]OHD44381.1 MAG: hypothetical protein A2086_03630 [Spirochaetes bacterium GWD1_27_9]
MRASKVLFLLLMISVFVSSNLFSFGPASHYSLLITVKNKLPVGSKIRTALEQYINIATTGANGPDIGYGQVRSVMGYAPWADQYHYDKVGSMAYYQLKDALRNNNNQQIAWAAGWITHVVGDLACHGKFVNPEPGVGVYMDNPSGRDLHKNLERWAEPYIWVYAGLNISNYNKSYLPSIFSINSTVISHLTATSQKVYLKSPTSSEVQNWFSLYTTSLSLGVGAYVYTDYNTALQNLNIGTRKARLESAFNTAINDAVKLLLEVEASY